MLKSLFAIAIFTSLSLTSSAQPTGKTVPVPALCLPAQAVIENLKQNGELPVFTGTDNFLDDRKPGNIATVLMLNEKTGDYTMLLVVKDAALACIISTGYGKINVGKPV